VRGGVVLVVAFYVYFSEVDVQWLYHLDSSSTYTPAASINLYLSQFVGFINASACKYVNRI